MVDGDAVALLSVQKHNRFTAEIYVMGVMPSFHGQRIGTQLLRAVERELAAQGLRFLTVKTLSESKPSEDYARTRQFYLQAGFFPLEEFKTLWGENNPCLLMVKQIASPT